MQSQKKSSNTNSCLSNQCFCSCRIYQNTNQCDNDTQRYSESLTHQQDEYSGNKNSKKNPCHISNYHTNEDSLWIDNQTLHTLSSLREKACKFIKSESENTSDFGSSDNTCGCQTENLKGEKSMLRKAHEIIDYVPESMFLKKVKEDSLCSGNNMDGLNFLPENGGSNYFVPPLSEKCVAQVIKVGEQVNNGQMKNLMGDCRRMCICCNRHRDLQLDISGIGFIEDIQRNNRNDCVNGSINGKNFKINNYSHARSSEKEKKEHGSKKSCHVSRSKKPNKYRRGKRKSNNVEKLVSQECFEPTLKRPHQNSCERCWRYASPSRSPVNKPDQRYDPNFRKAHSATDVTIGEKRGKEGSPEIIREHITPLRNISPTMCDKSTEPLFGHYIPEKYSPDYNFKRTKECPHHRSGTPENYSEILRTSNNFKQAISPVCPDIGTIYSDLGKNVRPKSCTPGISRPARNLSKLLDDLDVTECKEKTFRSSANKESCKSPKTNTNIVLPPPKDNSLERSGSTKKGKTREDVESTKTSSKLSSSSRKKGKSGGDVESPKNSSKLSSSSKQNKDKYSATRPATQPESKSKNSRSSPLKNSKQTLSGEFKKNQTLPSKPRFLKCKRKLDFGPSPRTPTSGSNPPRKTPSPGEVKDKSSRFNDQNQRSSSQQSKPSSVRDAQSNEMSGCIKVAGQVMDPPHKFRDCACYLQSPQTRTTCNSKKSNRENLCCHCLIENEKYQNSERCCCFPGSPGSPLETSRQNSTPNNKNFFRSSFDQNEKKGSNNKNCSKFDNAHICPCKKESVGKYIMHEYSGSIISCPFHQNVNSNAFVNESSPGGCKQFPERFESLSPNYTPKKYCVFYMTKSKEGKGDDVEVLVEELTQRSSNKKGTKNDALRNKMEKVCAYQSDSLALRFQKGVSELCRSNPSSRILYF